MPAAELQQLADDIKSNGLREPVVVLNREILDGWHRFRACEMAGVLCVFENFPANKDPIAFVASKNLHRRSLTPSQRAVIEVQIREWVANGTNQHTQTGLPRGVTLPPATTKQMAKEAGVSVNTINRAKEAVQNGHAKAVISGEMSVSKAAEKPDTKPKQPTATEKATAEVEEWKEKYRESDELRAELAIEYESAVLAVQPEDEQLVRFREMNRTINTLESLLRVEQEKSNALVKEVKFLRRELKKLGWE